METISHDIRYKAAAAVFALGTRCESKGRAPDMPPKNGWVKSGAGSLYIWPEKLREAIAYFDIAISILPEASWTYAKALLLEQLSDFAAAEQAFLDLSGGHYAHPGAKGAQRCAQKRLGTYNAKSTFATAFAEMTEGLAGAKGKNPGLAEAMQYVQSLADSFLGGSAAAPAADSAAPGPTVVTTAEVPVDTDDDDPAVVAAVHFVDRLLLQRYDEAHALLHSSLAATVSAAELQNPLRSLVHRRSISRERECDGAATRLAGQTSRRSGFGLCSHRQ